MSKPEPMSKHTVIIGGQEFECDANGIIAPEDSRLKHFNIKSVGNELDNSAIINQGIRFDAATERAKQDGE